MQRAVNASASAMGGQTPIIVVIALQDIPALEGAANLLLIATYGWSGILVHPAPVFFHRFHVFEFFIANVAMERLAPVDPKEATHALLWLYLF
jgi:hypothetical protein